MTKADVLKILIKFFKDLNAVDPNLSDTEIEGTRLPDLDLFKHELTDDHAFKKEVVFKRMVAVLKEAHPNKITPEISPQEATVFDRSLTIGQLAEQIANDTPHRIL